MKFFQQLTSVFDSIKKKKYSTVATTSSSSTIFSNPISSKKLSKKAVHLPFDFDQWYDQLKAHTFKSSILTVDPDTANAMVHFYQTRFLEKDSLTDHDIELLNTLKNQIAAEMTTLMQESSSGIFVRMSDRSPKDGTPLRLTGPSLLDTYRSILKNDAGLNANEQMVAMTDAQMKFLLCLDSDQVMNLLLSSERVYSDLLLALDCHAADPNDYWNTSVILREWQPALRQDMEFRVFVANGKVSAISQYNNYCQFDSLTSLSKEELQNLSDRIIDYVSHLHPIIDKNSYILDIAVINENIAVIELNPFDNTTGSCLYSWKTDHDLLHGLKDEKVVIKIRETPMENIQTLVNNTLTNEIESNREMEEPYYNFMQKNMRNAPKNV